MKAIVINGSSRKDGNTAIMLKALISSLEAEGVDAEMIQLAGKKIAGCRACYKCVKNKDRRCSVKSDAANEIIEKMEQADVIVIGSPTYFADLSATTKALIERAGLVGRANGDIFRRKLGAAVSVARRGGAIQTFNSINYFFTISQMIIVGSNYWNLGFGHDPGDVEKDEEGIETMKILGINIAWLLKKIKG